MPGTFPQLPHPVNPVQRSPNFPLRGRLPLPKTPPSLRFPLGHSLKKLFQLLFVFLGCLHLTGGPYSLMQGYAWVGMLVSYSQQDGLIKATKDTFSGEKPCELCCKIADARDSEPETKAPVAPVSSFSGKLIQEILPPRETVMRPPSATDLPPIDFPGIQLPPDFPKACPPVPPPCLVA
jgi:hypothetical protein